MLNGEEGEELELSEIGLDHGIILVSSEYICQVHMASRTRRRRRRVYGRSIGNPLGTRFGADFDKSRAASSVNALM